MYESVDLYERPSCYPLRFTVITIPAAKSDLGAILERFTLSHIHTRLFASGLMQSTRPHGHGRSGSYRRIEQDSHIWKCRMGVQHIDPIFVLGRVLLIEIVA
jgi:hypothetical protein